MNPASSRAARFRPPLPKGSSPDRRDDPGRCRRYRPAAMCRDTLPLICDGCQYVAAGFAREVHAWLGAESFAIAAT